MQVYKNLAKFISYDAIEKVPGKPPLIEVKYTRPDYQDSKKVFTVGQWESKLDEAVLEKILDLSVDDTFCIHVEKTDRGALNLKDISDSSDAPQKTQQRSKYAGNKGGAGARKAPDPGAQVGNALNVAAITLGAGSTLEEIEERAIGVLEIGEKLKKKLLAIQGDSTTDSAVEKKPVSKLEAMKKKKATAKTAAKKSASVDESDLEELNEMESDLIDEDVDEMDDWE